MLDRSTVKLIKSVIRKMAFVTIVVGVCALMLVLHLAALDVGRREDWGRQKAGNYFKMRRNYKGALELLINYSTRFGDGTVRASPDKIHSVQLWYEAAAMIKWYISPTEDEYLCKILGNFDNWVFCKDKNLEIKAPCLVYSFGVRNNFQFEDSFGRLGCDVRSFDPSTNMTDHTHNKTVKFYDLGVGPLNTNVFMPTRRGAGVNQTDKGDGPWKLRTLKSIMEMLRQQNKILDVVKIDIKSNLWVVLDNILETGAWRQIRHLLLGFNLYPTHPHKEDYVIFYRTLTKLRERGFVEYFGQTDDALSTQGDHFTVKGRTSFYNFNLLLGD
ncbi:uncharacterized protein LOC131942046 [Physella acuta]|uniref:uncharacterized protein LOC131942046 n=1 Tax=Physella acuta TaxID=109671 RepID=UPI0027DC887A|nr:uncharacterized protein LOC131942046 [Physella acuta]